MEQEQLLRIRKNLQDVPKGTLKVEHHFNGHTETNLFTEIVSDPDRGKRKNGCLSGISRYPALFELFFVRTSVFSA